MQKPPKLPKLYTTDEYEGYDINELSDYLMDIGLFEQFQTWFAGKTGGIMTTEKGNRFIVYKSDADKFLQRHTN